MDAMILMRRLNGTELGVNADLIERVESTPDTVLTLIDGTKYIVAEPAEEVIALIVDFRARILAAAEGFSEAGEYPAGRTIPLRLVDNDVATQASTDESIGEVAHLDPTSFDATSFDSDPSEQAPSDADSVRN